MSFYGQETVTYVFPFLGEDDTYIIIKDAGGRKRQIAKSRAGYLKLGTIPETVEVTMSWKYADHRERTGDLIFPDHKDADADLDEGEEM